MRKAHYVSLFQMLSKLNYAMHENKEVLQAEASLKLFPDNDLWIECFSGMAGNRLSGCRPVV
jgi:hypothetical protein